VGREDEEESKGVMVVVRGEIVSTRPVRLQGQGHYEGASDELGDARLGQLNQNDYSSWTRARLDPCQWPDPSVPRTVGRIFRS